MQFHHCRSKLLNKCQEEFDRGAAATESVEHESMAPLTPVHKGTFSERQALQVAAQAAAVQRKVCPHLTTPCYSALVCMSSALTEYSLGQNR